MPGKPDVGVENDGVGNEKDGVGRDGGTGDGRGNWKMLGGDGRGKVCIEGRGNELVKEDVHWESALVMLSSRALLFDEPP